MLLHSCQLDNNRVHSKDVYFFPDLVQPPYPTVHVWPRPPCFCFPLPRGCWGAPAVFICFSNVVQSQSSTAAVVLWTKCPALVTPTLKHPYFKKSPITSAGMSRQAMSTTATVGCLNSCYTRFSYRICVSSCLVATLHCSPCCRSSTSFILFCLQQLRRLFFRATGYIEKYSCVWLITPNFHPNS